jgi:hypothetical protein
MEKTTRQDRKHDDQENNQGKKQVGLITNPTLNTLLHNLREYSSAAADLLTIPWFIAAVCACFDLEVQQKGIHSLNAVNRHA